MSKSSKGLISKISAFVVIVAAMMTCVFVSTAMADETKWLYGDESIPAVFGFNIDTTTTRTIGNRTSTFADAIFTDGTGAIKGQTGYDINKAAGKDITMTPEADGSVKLYIMRDNGSNGTLKIVDDAGIEIFNGAIYARDNNTGVEAITFDVTANTTYTINAPSTTTMLFGATFTTSGATTTEVITWGGVQSMANATSGTDVRLLATLATEDITGIDEVGFAVSKTYATANEMTKLGSNTVFTSVLAGSTVVNPTDINAGATYIAAHSVTGMPNDNTLYVYVYSTTDGVTTYSTDCYTVSIDTSGNVTAGTYTIA